MKARNLPPVSDALDKIAILANTILFSGLEGAELAGLAKVVRKVELKARQALFYQGDPGDNLYILVSGVVRISSTSEDGREVTLNLIKPPQIIGEIAALDGSERTADAYAVEDAVLLTLSREHLLDFLTAHPEASMRLMAALCERLRWVSGQLDDVNFLDLKARLAKRLLLLADLFGRREVGGRIRITLRLSQQDLATHIGATRESINKLLRQWEVERLISQEAGRIVINDLRALREL